MMPDTTPLQRHNASKRRWRGLIIALLLCCTFTQFNQHAANGQSLASRIADSEFSPITDAQFDQHVAQIRSQLEKLRTALGSDANGLAWQTYLMCDEVAKVIEMYPSDDVDETAEMTNIVSRCYFRTCSLHPGIEKQAIADFRDAIHAVRLAMLQRNQLSAEAITMQFWQDDVEMFPDDEEIKKDRPQTTAGSFANKTRQLAELLAQEPARLNASQIRKVSSLVSWLRGRQQIPRLLDEVEAKYGRPNIDIQISANALGDMTVTPAREVEKINRMEDGVHITGQAVASGHARMFPVAGNGTGRCEVRFTGNVVTTLHGAKGPASFDLRGVTMLNATKPVLLTSEDLSTERSIAYADTDLRTQRVCSKLRGVLGRLVRRIASKQINEQRPQASRDLSKESATSFLEQFDEQVEDEIAAAQSSLNADLHLPLKRLDLQPRQFDFLTDEQTLSTRLRFGSGFSSTTPGSSTFAGIRNDIIANVHESTINSICHHLFAGRPIRNFRDVVAVLGVDLADNKLDEIPEDVGLQFSMDNPVLVEFDKDRVKITISADSWTVGKYELVGMIVSLSYRLDHSAPNPQLVLDDQFEISAPNGAFGGRFAAQKNVLQRRLQKDLPASMPIETIPVASLPDMVDKLGNLSFQQILLQDGWLQIMIQGDRNSI